MKFEITHNITKEVLFKCDTYTMRDAVIKAIESGADLSGADLSRMNLSGIDFSRLNLSKVNFYGSNLSSASFFGADLSEANLSRTDLISANLSGSKLSGLNLLHTDYSRANLSKANVDGEIIKIAPICILNLNRDVLITGKYMRIGNERYSHDKWKSFDDQQILKMFGKATDFWSLWKDLLLAMCDIHRTKSARAKYYR